MRRCPIFSFITHGLVSDLGTQSILLSKGRSVKGSLLCGRRSLPTSCLHQVDAMVSSESLRACSHHASCTVPARDTLLVRKMWVLLESVPRLSQAAERSRVALISLPPPFFRGIDSFPFDVPFWNTMMFMTVCYMAPTAATSLRLPVAVWRMLVSNIATKLHRYVVTVTV